MVRNLQSAYMDSASCCLRAKPSCRAPRAFSQEIADPLSCGDCFYQRQNRFAASPFRGYAFGIHRLAQIRAVDYTQFP